ncbi:hypothetical protein ACWCQN_38675 [Streptomyces sp. NPDC001984]
MNTLLDQFAASLGEDEDSVTATIGDSLYVRYANDPAVLKITCLPGDDEDEVEVVFEYIHPEHGQIDAVPFVLTRSQNFSKALERLEAYRDIWFV